MNARLAGAITKALHSENIKFVGWTAASAAAMTLLATLQVGADFANRQQDIPWIGILLARTVNCFAYAIFIPPLWFLARRRPIDAPPLMASVALYLGVSLIVALAKESIFVTVGNLFRPGVFVLWDILAEDYLDEVLTVWGLIALAHAFALHRRSQAGRKDSAARPNAMDYLTFQAEGAVHRVRLADIERAEAQGNYVEVSTGGGRWLIRETMNRLESRMGGGFVRVHRRHIINADKVIRVEPRAHSEYWLVLVCGDRVPTSRQYKEQVRQHLLKEQTQGCDSSQPQSSPSQLR